MINHIVATFFTQEVYMPEMEHPVPFESHYQPYTFHLLYDFLGMKNHKGFISRW